MGRQGTTMRLGWTLSFVTATAISTAACGGDSARDGRFFPMHQSEEWNDVGGQSRLRLRHRRLVSGREPNCLARHFARRLLQPGSCLRCADVPECLEHGRLCNPPYMSCRLTACIQSLHGQKFGGDKAARRWTMSLCAAVASRCAALQSSGEPVAWLLKFWALPNNQAIRDEEIRSYPLLRRQMTWFAMIPRPERARPDQRNHLIDAG